MPRAGWVMSESDTFDLLNAIDDRLARARLDQQRFDTLVRLRALLEDDLSGYASQRARKDAEIQPDRIPPAL